MDPKILFGEIFGTMFLILLGDGVVAGVLLAKSKAQNAGWIVITAAWAFAVFVGVVVSAPFSGAHLNPAVTLGLYTQSVLTGGTMGIDTVAVYIVGQMIGALIGAALVALHYWPHWKETEDPGLKLAVFSTGPAIRSYAFNFISEVIGTFVLVFVILSFGDHTASIGPLAVTVLVWSIGMSLGGTTGYAINPARDLGPRIIHQLLPIPGKGSSDWAYSWIPVAGPLVGGVLAAVLFNVYAGLVK
ncbi:MAG TPA: MIP/aquaporin family protein [Candidatus Limnocylindrales bacterium]|nr:MIP/aquaporin family protein [Candidatus Limnocylindrales bacterium]